MDLQERIEALETEFADKIKTLKAEAQREDKFPQDGNWYWYITSDVGIDMGSWGDLEFEKEQLSIGNVFRTREQAGFAVEKLKVEAELRKYSDSWNLEETQYTFSLDWESRKLEVEYPDYNQFPNSYYFDSINGLRLAIETVGEERIKKYIFGVED